MATATACEGVPEEEEVEEEVEDVAVPGLLLELAPAVGGMPLLSLTLRLAAIAKRFMAEMGEMGAISPDCG